MRSAQSRWSSCTLPLYSQESMASVRWKNIPNPADTWKMPCVPVHWTQSLKQDPADRPPPRVTQHRRIIGHRKYISHRWISEDWTQLAHLQQSICTYRVPGPRSEILPEGRGWGTIGLASARAEECCPSFDWPMDCSPEPFARRTAVHAGHRRLSSAELCGG